RPDATAPRPPRAVRSPAGSGSAAGAIPPRRRPPAGRTAPPPAPGCGSTRSRSSWLRRPAPHVGRRALMRRGGGRDDLDDIAVGEQAGAAGDDPGVGGEALDDLDFGAQATPGVHFARAHLRARSRGLELE